MENFILEFVKNKVYCILRIIVIWRGKYERDTFEKKNYDNHDCDIGNVKCFFAYHTNG